MRYIIAVINLVILAVAVVFALSNAQEVSVSLWPTDIVIKAPVFMVALGTLGTGMLVGGCVVWLAHVPQRFRARTMAKDLVRLGDRLLEVERELDKYRAKEVQLPSIRLPRWKFWKRKP